VVVATWTCERTYVRGTPVHGPRSSMQAVAAGIVLGALAAAALPKNFAAEPPPAQDAAAPPSVGADPAAGKRGQDADEDSERLAAERARRDERETLERAARRRRLREAGVDLDKVQRLLDEAGARELRMSGLERTLIVAFKTLLALLAAIVLYVLVQDLAGPLAASFPREARVLGGTASAHTQHGL